MPGSEDLVLFTHLVRKPQGKLDLERAALLIAEPEYPGLDIGRYVARLDELGALTRARLETTGLRPASAPPSVALPHLLGFLYGELGFRGNVSDYYDPRNSFLNEVLDRRTGIPISLALVLMAVARRAGLAIDGVSFPGHFLARTAGDDGHPVFIDPFDGRILSGGDLHGLWEQVTGNPGPIDQTFLQPATRCQILARMLNNLRAIYEVRGDGRRLCQVLARLAILNPCEDAQRRLESAQAAPPLPRITIN
jgi:regulator of sirC expression with transglutaminase-like and TPR domain